MTVHEKTVAIAIIGVTGSGKSTFINLASGSNPPVSKSRRSRTAELQSSTFSLDGHRVTLIDTPGFDDGIPSVLDVLKMISDYFSRLYSQGTKLAGVIYMHRGTKDRMGGSSRRNFQTFCKFCGDTSLRDVVVVSDKCPEEVSDDGSDDAGEPRSGGREELFMWAVDKGVRMLRHDGSRASAHAIVRQIINRKSTTPPVKTETYDRPTGLTCTSAPVDTIHDLTDRMEHHTKAFEKLCQAIDTATSTGGKRDKEALRREARTSLDRIERIRCDLEQLVTNFETERSQLDDENQWHKNTSSVQRTEGEPRVQAREFAGSWQRQAETQEAGERGLWEREMGKEILTVHAAGKQYVKRFAYVAVIFALVCVSRIVLHGSSSLLL